MLDRRGFLAAMFGAAVAPKDVLMGLATPAPIKKAVEVYGEWTCVWREVGQVPIEGGTMHAWEVTFEVPSEIAHLFPVKVHVV